jgi:hypothetical protein
MSSLIRTSMATRSGRAISSRTRFRITIALQKLASIAAYPEFPNAGISLLFTMRYDVEKLWNKWIAGFSLFHLVLVRT